jgi:hypothetical protein
MTTTRITLDNGDQYDLTLTKVSATTQPPPPPPVEKPPVVATPPAPPVVAGANQIRTAMSLKFTNEIRAAGGTLPNFSLGADQELAIEVPWAEFPDVLFSLFQPSAGLSMAIDNVPWRFPAGGVRRDQPPKSLLADTVGGLVMQQKELRVPKADLPPPTPQGTLFINVRWLIATAFGPNAPMRNFLKEQGHTFGNFQLRKDQ